MADSVAVARSSLRWSARAAQAVRVARPHRPRRARRPASTRRARSDPRRSAVSTGARSWSRPTTSARPPVRPGAPARPPRGRAGERCGPHAGPAARDVRVVIHDTRRACRALHGRGARRRQPATIEPRRPTAEAGGRVLVVVRAVRRVAVLAVDEVVVVLVDDGSWPQPSTWTCMWASCGRCAADAAPATRSTWSSQRWWTSPSWRWSTWSSCRTSASAAPAVVTVLVVRDRPMGASAGPRELRGDRVTLRTVAEDGERGRSVRSRRSLAAQAGPSSGGARRCARTTRRSAIMWERARRPPSGAGSERKRDGQERDRPGPRGHRAGRSR